METRETVARDIASTLDAIIERAQQHKLDTVVYVLETAKVEALRATRPKAALAPVHARQRF